MKAEFVWSGSTGKTLVNVTLYGPSTEGLVQDILQLALSKASLHKPPVTKWKRLVITVDNNS